MKTNERSNYNALHTNKIVLACSGSSNLGELTDKVSRKLESNCVYNMKCLAMVATNQKDLIETIKSSETLVIDGCPVDCGKKIMEEAWLTNYQYVRLTDFGLIKDQSPVNDEIVDRIYNQILNGSEINTMQQELLFKEPCCDEENCDMFDFMSDYVGLKILHPGGKDSTKQIFDLLSLKKGIKVLDIACGKGRTSVEIAKKYGCQVIGVDILENSIKEAKKYARKNNVEHLVTFIKADAENLPFNANEFDITIAQAMLILVNNKAKVASEALRVLKPGGKSAWIELSWKKQPHNGFIEKASQEICAKCISNVVTFNDWQSLFSQTGYTDIETNHYDMTYRGFSKMIEDEGLTNGFKVMFRFITKPKIRKRMKKLDTFFKTYPEFLGYGIYIGKK